MARKRSRNAYRKANRGGYYKFTAKRRYALQRAADISARKRSAQRKKQIIRTSAAVAGLAGVGAASYLGWKNRESIGAKISKTGPGKYAVSWKKAVQPGAKEATRVSSAISVAHPSQTTVISPDARARADKERARLEKLDMPPIYDSTGKNIGGPDRRKYDEDDNVVSEAMTERGVVGTLIASEAVNPKEITDPKVRGRVRRAKKRIAGKKAESLTGTPGGTQTPKKAIKKPGAKSPSGMTDAQMEAAFGFDVIGKTPVQPVKMPKPVAGTKAPAAKASPKVAPASSSAPKSDIPLFSHGPDIKPEKPRGGHGSKVKNWDLLDEELKKQTRQSAKKMGFIITDQGLFKDERFT